MMNCISATHLLSESMDRKLTLKEKVSLEVHLMMCSGCRNFGRHMQVIRNVSGAYAKGENEADNASEGQNNP